MAYLTVDDIKKWINEWADTHKNYTNSELASFANELQEQVGQMNFCDPKGRAATGYGGVTYDGGTGIWQTVKSATEGNANFGYISDVPAANAIHGHTDNRSNR